MSLSKSLQEEVTMKQGIVTILNSDCDGILSKSAASIRRTLSADMSSKRWLSQNGFSKKVEVDLDKIPGQDDVWRSIQEKNNHKLPAAWGSILITQKSDGSLNDDATKKPYVHPMVKRSASCLSEKSLDICTESLGSETGSDVLASYPCSEFSSDGDEDREKIVTQVDDCSSYKEPNPFEDLHVAKYKNSPVRPFPPPLSSIGGGDGAVQMHSRRENGRLVVEAVSVPPRNFFQARRSGGRLVLSLIQSSREEKLVEEAEEHKFAEVFDDMEEVGGDIEEEDLDCGYFEEDEEEEENVAGYAEENTAAPERNLKSLLNGTVMKKLMAFGNKNPYVTAAEEDMDLTIPQSLPPPPRVASFMPTLAPPAAASFNAYEYFWRSKTTVVAATTTTAAADLKNKSINGVKKENQENLVVMRGNKGECFVPYLKGCKEPRRSLFWEPYCIATS